MTGLVLVSVILISLELTTRLLGPVRSAIGTVVSPVQYVAETPYLLGGEVGEVVATRSLLLDQNKELERKVLELSKISMQYLNLLKENENLRELLGSQARLPDEVLIAELIGVVPAVNAHQVVIDKGADSGIVLGQAVIDSEGLFGQVAEVDRFTSRVLLITDKDHAVPVQINRNGVRSIAGGTGRIDRLELEYVPITADIVKGDLVETSGLGGRFPQGYPVGYVDTVVVDPTASFAEVSIRPTALLDRSRHVLVVFARAGEES
ncbi:MAG: rod shape-determining protein MreC [Gammaproteobacteria bacterium]|nr:rod shape-determining protein MreC [Gammaproteobacteria bacterium]